MRLLPSQGDRWGNTEMNCIKCSNEMSDWDESMYPICDDCIDGTSDAELDALDRAESGDAEELDR